MKRNLNILSLDLDWFNFVPWTELSSFVDSFFTLLDERCYLPASVSFMSDHESMYSWCDYLLEEHKSSKINVINIDEHHDFYFLNGTDFRNMGEMTCGNFFAFMQYHGMINFYTWVTNAEDEPARKSLVKDLNRNIKSSNCDKIKSIKRRVVSADGLWYTISGKRFDGFCIVRSKEYTSNRAIIEEKLRDILQSRFMYEDRRPITTGW